MSPSERREWITLAIFLGLLLIAGFEAWVVFNLIH